MYSVMKKYRRRLMAFFAAGLMIAFLIPMTGRIGQGGPGKTVIGTTDGQKIYAVERINAQQEWDLLRRDVLVGPGRPLALNLGMQAYQQIEEHPDLYMLLQREARQMGVFVPQQRVEEIYASKALHINRQLARYDEVQFVKRALANFLMVSEAFGRAADAVKVSQPYCDFELATRGQQMRVDAVEFTAADFTSKLSPPTAEQLQELYDKWVDVDPQRTDPATNPAGLGYRFSDRVKLQYLCIPYAELHKAVESRQRPDRWEVDARIYYAKNKPAYTATTQQVVPPATQPTTLRVQKSFEEVRKEITDYLIGVEVEKLQGEVYRYVSGVLSSDYQAFAAAAGKAPVSSEGVAYNEYSYLQKLAADVQQRFNVTLSIEQWSNWLSQRDLAAMGKVAAARTTTGIEMPFYATLDPKADKATVEKLQRRNPGLPRALEILQPSQIMKDEANNVYVFRLLATDKARKPTGLDEVRAQVQKDWYLLQTMKLAREAADAFLAQAKAKGFATATQQAKKPLLSSDYFNHGTLVLGLHLADDAAAERFTSQAAGLLAMRTSEDIHPISVIELPRDGRVFVAQLGDVRSLLPADAMARIRVAAVDGLRGQLQMLLRNAWFDYGDVVKRMKYVPSKNAEDVVPVEDTSPANWPSL